MIKNPDALTRDDLEKGNTLALRFNSDGLIPVFVADATSGQPLMQAYMNADAVMLTLQTKEAHYWSRSRQELWHKGATSGQIQKVKTFSTDCDQDSLWMTVEQMGGGCCHVGYSKCFYREIELSDEGQPRLRHIEEPPVKG